MGTEIINIAGRYNKYLRNLSQSPWIDKDDVRIRNSVQELLEEGIKKFLKYEKLVFATSGREDVDVRMLGRGRPFVFKVHNPENVHDYNPETLRSIERFINQEHSGKVAVRDLQIVSKNSVYKHLKDGQESKTKEYRALCCCSRKLLPKDIELINSLTDLDVEQKTPIRVLHRRTLATRSRMIKRLKIEPVKYGDFDCLKLDDLDYVFSLTLLAEAGTYIKEFVHGDFGRTKPSLSSLIGDCETDLMELDVMEVYLDWPPPLDSKEQPETANCPIVDSEAEKMDMSDEELSDIYSEAIKSMQAAESKPRGDERQGLYMKSKSLFQKASTIVDKLDLFSDNETLEDIATVNLKYLLIPAYEAKVVLSSECGVNRLETFKAAESNIKKFLRNASNYGFACNQIEQTLTSSDVSTPSFTQPQLQSLEASMQARNEKIEKYKRMKELEARLDELESRMKNNQDVDDEVVRDFYVNQINKWVEDMLESLEREVKPALFFEKTKTGNNSEPIPPTKSPKLSHPTDKTITIVKDQMQKEVFGLGYPSLPTVTVDEFIQKKINDGSLEFESKKQVYSNSLQRYAEQPNLRRDQEEQSDEDREAKEDKDDPEELARKRRWDEFKDETPRGSGNRHNMG